MKDRARFTESSRCRRLAAAFAVAVSAIGLTACPGPSGAIVGDLLSGISSQVDGIIGQASSQGQVLLVTAAGQVDLAVDNARSALAGDLEKGINDVDDSAQRTIANLQALSDNLVVHSNETLNAAILGAQQIVNSLPFGNRNPQVTRFSPQFLSTTTTDSVEIDVEGNFVWAYQEKLPTTLEVGGVLYNANLDTTSHIGFEIPRAAFHSSADKILRVAMTLTVPYEKGKVFKHEVPGVFHLLVTVLPTSPFKSLTITSDVDVAGVETHTLVAPPGASMSGGGWTVRSDNWGTGNCQDAHDSHEISASPDGWRIDPSSATTVVRWSKSPEATKTDITARTSTGLVAEAWTTAHCFLGISDGSGVVTYFVQYMESRPTTTKSSQTYDLLPLNWGDQRVMPVPRNGWKVHAELWNGTVLEFSTTDARNPYINVADGGDHVTVGAASPGGILLAL